MYAILDAGNEREFQYQKMTKCFEERADQTGLTMEEHMSAGERK